MRAKYICSTDGEPVEVVADVTKSVEEVKLQASIEHGIHVIDVIEELPLFRPRQGLEEYTGALKARFKKSPIVKSKQPQRKPKLKPSGFSRKSGRPKNGSAV